MEFESKNCVDFTDFLNIQIELIRSRVYVKLENAPINLALKLLKVLLTIST